MTENDVIFSLTAQQIQSELEMLSPDFQRFLQEMVDEYAICGATVRFKAALDMLGCAVDAFGCGND